MTATAKACVDCATPLIGDSVRCGACADAAARAARPRSDGAPTVLARWAVVIELLIIVTLGLLLAVRGCTS